jgi:hypothetical protein
MSRRLNDKLVKIICIFLTLVFSIAAARADLVMELNYTSPKIKLVVKIKEDKICYDTFINENEVWSLIVDLKTDDRFRLDRMSKGIVKNPSILHDDTNAIAKAEWPKFQDTGKTETLNGYEAEIYKWTNFDGLPETLWVAKNYPNFGKIKNDLSKLDIGKLNNIKIGMPQLSSLSGMPLKLLIAHNISNTNGIDLPITLLSAKEESLDDTNFDLPKDYHFYSTNAPVANTNEAVSTTNEPSAK